MPFAPSSFLFLKGLFLEGLFKAALPAALVAMASNLVTMLSNLVAMASNLVAKKAAFPSMIYHGIPSCTAVS